METTSTLTMGVPFPIALTATARGLTCIRIVLTNEPASPDSPVPGNREAERILETTAEQLVAYFAGRRRNFDLPLAPGGTPFQERCWDQLQRIPYGATISYAELARRVGNPKACRAVGAANGRNPIPIVIPCHRVIGSSGKLHGFAYGLDIKRQLIDLEIASLSASGEPAAPTIDIDSKQRSSF
ncbi:MAG: methylated-DNA--[protein]-cysteine S-methyltransferase [Acidobacteria bacterium]|nr:methylated-DNA--[protein]-cysteine S-methyltransferase [Acidobacteriota bacterium]